MADEIRIERLLEAPVTVVFAQWLDAEARRSWYAPEAGWVVTDAASDIRVGGGWHVAFGPAGQEPYRESGVFAEIDPPRRVVYTSTLEHPDGRVDPEEVDTVGFEARGAKTLLSVVAVLHPDEQPGVHQLEGWRAFVDSFERWIASG